MTLFWVNGQIVDDQEGHVPEGSIPVPTYQNQAQFGDQRFSWDPQNRYFSGNIEQTAPGYLPELFARRDRQRSGQLQPWEAEEVQRWEATARAMPTRDIGALTAGWQGEKDDPAWWSRLDPLSPDVGGVALQLKDKIDAGTASPEERQLFQGVMQMAGDWNWRASVPQESDANPFGMGDQLFGALGTLALGATGGLAAAPLFAGGAGLATTLGSLGTLSGIAGTGAGVLGGALDEPWLQKLGLGLGAAGGIAGGVGGLSNLFSTGVNSLSDAARLASNAGRVVGGVGSIADNDVLRQAGGWLGTAGQLGGGVENLRNLLSGTGGSLQGVLGLARPLQRIAGQFMQPGGQPESGAARPQGPGPSAPRPVSAQQSAPQMPLAMAPAAQPGMAPPGAGSPGILGLLQASQQAQQRGRTMTDEDWLRPDWRLRNPAARSVLYNL